MEYDLLVKNGLVVDPSQRIEGIRDLAISHGKVIAIEPQIKGDAKQMIDARDKIVTPGLIDLHAHVYHAATDNGVNAGVHCLLHGVTTVVDGGSSGAMNFQGFRQFIHEGSQTRMFCFLSVCKLGVELGDLRHLDFNAAVNVAQANRDVIVGIKLRLGEKRTGMLSPHYLRLAKEVARTAGIPLMVHIFGPDPLLDTFSLSEILKVLESGDIITHSFHPIRPPFDAIHSIFDRETNIIKEVVEARKRGVLFDVGHGRYQFSWQTAEKAIQNGFLPDTISSDLTKYSVDTIVYDLPTVLSKFLHSGLSLYEVVERSTINPAKILGMNECIGTLKPGTLGDVAIFQLDEGKYALWDNLSPQREQRIITQRLNPIQVIKAGQIIQ